MNLPLLAQANLTGLGDLYMLVVAAIFFVILLIAALALLTLLGFSWWMIRAHDREHLGTLLSSRLRRLAIVLVILAVAVGGLGVICFSSNSLQPGGIANLLLPVRSSPEKDSLEVLTNTGITTAVGSVGVVLCAILIVGATWALARAKQAQSKGDSLPE